MTAMATLFPVPLRRQSNGDANGHLPIKNKQRTSASTNWFTIFIATIFTCLLMVELIPSVNARLILTQHKQSAIHRLELATIDYYQSKDSYQNRTGIAYFPTFLNNCQVEQPPMLSIQKSGNQMGTSNNATFNSSITWTVAVVIGKNAFDRGCTSYKQITTAIITASPLLAKSNYPPVGAVVVTSLYSPESFSIAISNDNSTQGEVVTTRSNFVGRQLPGGPTEPWCSTMAESPCEKQSTTLASEKDDSQTLVPLALLSAENEAVISSNEWGLQAQNGTTGTIFAELSQETGWWNDILLYSAYPFFTWGIFAANLLPILFGLYHLWIHRTIVSVFSPACITIIVFVIQLVGKDLSLATIVLYNVYAILYTILFTLVICAWIKRLSTVHPTILVLSVVVAALQAVTAIVQYSYSLSRLPAIVFSVAADFTSIIMIIRLSLLMPMLVLCIYVVYITQRAKPTQNKPIQDPSKAKLTTTATLLIFCITANLTIKLVELYQPRNPAIFEICRFSINIVYTLLNVILLYGLALVFSAGPTTHHLGARQYDPESNDGDIITTHSADLRNSFTPVPKVWKRTVEKVMSELSYDTGTSHGGKVGSTTVKTVDASRTDSLTQADLNRMVPDVRDEPLRGVRSPGGFDATAGLSTYVDNERGF